MQKTKLAKLLAPTVPLKLEVDADKNGVLELKLAWTMRAVILIEAKLRELGLAVNVIQNPASFWTDLNATTLAVAVWALSHQEHADLRDEEGFDYVISYLVPENWLLAADGIKNAFWESLSQKRRDEIEAGIRAAAEAVKAGAEAPANPTPAPAQQ